jgi:hypothetical protein
LGLAIHWVQQALISAYEDNCPLKPVKTSKQSLKWTSELESLRRGVRWLSKISAKQIMPIVGNSIERLSVDINEVQEAPKEAWRTSCSSINDIPRSTRLHMALSRDPKNRLGSLMAPFRRCVQFEDETSVATERDEAPAAARHAKHLDWRVAAKVVTYGRVVWANDSSVPYRPGMDGIFPALLQVGREVLISYPLKIFCACLATGYVPAIWRQVKAVFIPKPGRDSYGGPKDFRSISLASFLLKTMERLVDFLGIKFWRPCHYIPTNMHTRLGNPWKRPFFSSWFGLRRLTNRKQLWVFSLTQKGRFITPPMIPCVLHWLTWGRLHHHTMD